MKNSLLSLLAISLITKYFALTTCKAQTPQGIPYQAIARNASGAAIASTAVRVRFSIRDSIATGAIRYQETHNPTTSALGLFSVNVGMGTVVSGSFSGINWGRNAKFLQVELDPAGGTAYIDLGTTQMMSVPYALQANAIKMRTSTTGDTLYTGGGNYVIIPGISAANPSTGNPNWNGTTLTDIDGNIYQTVNIGNQIWMKENLKVSKYRNGDPIPTGLSNAAWTATTSGANAIYNNDPANNTIYGKLYNWYAVADPRGLCPAGWHVPTDHDWQLLTKYLDPAADTTQCCSNTAGGKMKSTGTIEASAGLWYSPNIDASNSSGFTGLPGGFRSEYGVYSDVGAGYYGYWWSSTGSSTSAWYLGIYFDHRYSTRYSNLKAYGFSVRCLRD